MINRDNQISRFLSYILHPLIIPTLVISALMMRSDIYSIVLPDSLKLWFISVFFAFTLLIPVTSMFIMLKFKAIHSLELKERNERTIPLLVTSTSFMALLFTLRPSGIPPVLLYVIYSATFTMLAGLLINMFYKISLHTLGWGAIATTLIGISIHLGIPLLTMIIISVILAGLAGYARLKQDAHNASQVYLGYVAGVCVILLLTFLQ
jgi:hypothetical protein